MAFYLSRRSFMAHSVKAGAAAAAVAVAPQVLAAEASVPEPEFAVSSDLLHSLGARIGLEVAQAIATPGTALSLKYLDAAGPSVDALREGLEAGARLENGMCPLCKETPAAYSSVLGVAVFRNTVTGRSASVEIFPSALTVIDSIASASGATSVHKLAVMTADASTLYRVEWS